MMNYLILLTKMIIVMSTWSSEANDVLENLDMHLKNFGIQVVLIMAVDYYAYKIEPINILSATKFYLERGINIE